MRFLRWLTVGIVSLLVAALLAAWLVPPSLDWNRYRGAIAAYASEQLGRTVEIDGPISLTLLPQPVLSASRVSVVDDTDSGAIHADALRLSVGLGPLLAGRVDARELVLRGLDVTLPWPLNAEAYRVRAPTWLSAVSARIENGRLSIGNVVFTNVDATLATDALTGSTLVAGTLVFSGQHWRSTARLTQPGSDGSAGVDATLDGQGPVQGIGAALTAQIDGDGNLGGRITARGPDLSQLLPAPAVPFKADGRVSIAGGLAEADDLAVEIGGSPARGAVALRVSPTPRLDVALAASRLDLDGWLPTILHGAASDLPTGIDLSAEAAQLAGGTLRRLRGAFDLHADSVDVRELRAILPGEASLSLSGRIGRKPNAPPSFAGTFKLGAPALRTTFGWLQTAQLIPASALPAGVLRAADLSGGMAIDSGQLSLSSLVGTVDGAQVSGTLNARPGDRFAIDAAISVDRLDLDPWLPDPVASITNLANRAGRFDTTLRLTAGRAMFRGTVLAPLSVDASLTSGRLALRRFDTTAEGVAITASGNVDESGVTSAGRLEMRTRDVAPVLGWIPDRLAIAAARTPALWHGPADLVLTAVGPPARLGITLGADLGDLRVEAQPTVDIPGRRWAGAVTVRHPGAPRFAEALGLVGAPAWLGDGSLALIAQVTASPDAIAASSFDLSAGSLHASGQLALALVGMPRLTGRLGADTLPLPLPYARAPEPLDVTSLRGWEAVVEVDAARLLAGGLPLLEQVAADVTLGNGRLRVDMKAGRLGGGALTGSASLDSSAEPPAVSLDASVKGATISGPLFDSSVDLSGGVADAKVTLTAFGHAPAALLATLGGHAHLAVRTGVLLGLDLAHVGVKQDDDAIRKALAGGSSQFDRLEVDLNASHGILDLAGGTLQAAAVNGDVAGHIDIPGDTVDLQLSLRPDVIDPPDIGLRLDGSPAALVRTPELANLARWRAEHAVRQDATAPTLPAAPPPAPG